MCSTELVTVNPSQFFLSPVVAVESALAIYQAKKDFIDRILREGVDFGTIPGSAGRKTLLKPGAEKLSSFFGLCPIFQDVETIEDWTGANHNGEPFFYYRTKCQLKRCDTIIAEADGSCNSWEKKYRYRSAGRLCPACGKPTLLRSKGDKPADAARKRREPSWEPGWFCWAKKGGCGGQFEYNDTRIPQQDAGSVPNPDVAEQVNTILKMSQKRSFIAANLIATGVSEYFTQDVEDFTPGDHSYEPQTDNAVYDVPSTAPPSKAATVATLAAEAKKLSPTGQHGTVSEGSPAGEPPKQTRTIAERTLAAVVWAKTASGEQIATQAKRITEREFGADNYRTIMAAFSERERELAPPEDVGECPDLDSERLAILRALLADANTAADCDATAKSWHDDSAGMSDEEYNEGVEAIARKKAGCTA